MAERDEHAIVRGLKAADLGNRLRGYSDRWTSGDCGAGVDGVARFSHDPATPNLHVLGPVLGWNRSGGETVRHAEGHDALEEALKFSRGRCEPPIEANREDWAPVAQFLDN